MARLPRSVLISPNTTALASLHDTGEALAQARGALEIAWLIAAGAAGEALRQAERRADEAERTRQEIARRRADEQRLHIARELHDLLTHQISVIKVQSEAAVHVARKRGEEVPEALLAIRVAEAADGNEGVVLARQHLPDIALIDIQMPVLDGIEATRRIAADPALTGVHVVILTNYGWTNTSSTRSAPARPASSSSTSGRKTSCTPSASPRAATPCSHRRSPAG